MTAYLLPFAEWSRVADRPPYDQTGLPAPDGHWQILVVEDRGGEIVASCAIFDTVHWDGFHVNEEARGNPAVFRALLEASLTALQDAGVAGAHITIPDGNPELEKMVESFGFIRAPGTLWLLAVPQKVST